MAKIVEEPDIGKEVQRILDIAKIYLDLQRLIPNYKSEYLDAYLEIAERIDPDNYWGYNGNNQTKSWNNRICTNWSYW